MSRPPLLLLLLLLPAARCPAPAATPRLRLSFPELRARHGLRLFQLERSCCYEALLLDEERSRLFVGAKNHLLSLSLDNISQRDRKIYWPAPVEWREECNWAGKDITADCMNFVKILHAYNRTHLYACGTGAFHPTCAFVEVGQHTEDHVFKLDARRAEDGKGKSPYDPRHAAASVLVGEELYSGVATDLMGRDFTIFRSMGSRPSVRTEQHDSRWLNEPKFVDVFWVPESENPDDDKIYFFFRETAVERQQGLGKASVSRIGQICRNDVGGQRSLVNKWTTFLKARLVCAVPGTDGADTHFDELRDVFLLQTRDKRNPLVYAAFSTSSSIFQGSAVCVYTMADIRRAFLGPFAHKEGPNYQWVPYQARVPYPRPGMCPSRTFGTFSSTKDFPDEVIQFARHHPLMYNPVLPHGQRPLFLQAGVPHTFTRIAVDRVAAADGHYDVLFIGTDVGTVLKVVSAPQQSWHGMEPLLLEELQVFQDASPIASLQLSSKRQQLYAGSATAVAQLPLHRCGAYGKACAECCLARDPYCAWDGTACTRFVPSTKRRSRRQDVRNGDPNLLCSEGAWGRGARCRARSGETTDAGCRPAEPSQGRVPQRQLYGVEGSSAFLECVPRSLRARVAWTYQRGPDAPQREVQPDERVVRTERGLLLRSVQRHDAGLYVCRATEQGFTQPVLRLALGVLSAAAPGGRAPWYRDFLQLLERPEAACGRMRPPPSRPGRAPRAAAGRDGAGAGGRCGAAGRPPPPYPGRAESRARPPQRLRPVRAPPGLRGAGRERPPGSAGGGEAVYLLTAGNGGRGGRPRTARGSRGSGGGGRGPSPRGLYWWNSIKQGRQHGALPSGVCPPTSAPTVGRRALLPAPRLHFRFLQNRNPISALPRLGSAPAMTATRGDARPAPLPAQGRLLTLRAQLRVPRSGTDTPVPGWSGDLEPPAVPLLPPPSLGWDAV
ncbi:semaphorin-3B isoform X3 [Gallus gallus]|nr:semaphorin-3B isoform X3 [Gallus gallus]XP_046756082.1 semaphorin-3B isoform X3 [Gallus gallus]